MSGIYGAPVGIDVIPVENSSSNPCVWYFLSVFVDTTVGVFILIFWLRIIDLFVRKFEIQGMKSGNYGSPPSIRIWAKQMAAFLTCGKLDL